MKVQGIDGKWSNLDSRVVMRMQNLINAEGELAARTDHQWVAALARHGFTLDDNGEVAELASAVRPLSRRSAQIESSRAAFLAQWRDESLGAEPSHDIPAQIDRRAWALARPNKPERLDDDEWEARVREELAAIDPAQPLADGWVPVRDEQIQTWADEAEAGIDIDLLEKRGRGRPGRGAEPAQVVALRLTAEERAELDALAARAHKTRSELICAALAAYAA